MCVEHCPGDLMAFDETEKKAYIREQKDCWDCMVCVKVCPCAALEVRLPYSLADYKASLQPKVFKDHIVWTLKDIDGNVERFLTKTKAE